MTGLLPLAVALSLASSPAHLALGEVRELVVTQTPGTTQVYDLNHSWLTDGVVTGIAGGLWLGSEFLFKHNLAPAECRLLCERDPEGVSTVNPIDLGARAVRWAPQNQRTAALISDAMVYLILPATVGGLQWYAASASGGTPGVWTDYLLILESAALAQVANQTVKFLVGRERPYSNALTLEERLARAGDDDLLSFYSGHATFSLALTVAAGTVAQLRGYKHAWLLWAVAVPLAATVPYFRMAADKHYLTDVLVGSLMGAAFGVAIPLIHGRANPQPGGAPAAVSFGAAPGGISISGTF